MSGPQKKKTAAKHRKAPRQSSASKKQRTSKDSAGRQQSALDGSGLIAEVFPADVARELRQSTWSVLVAGSERGFDSSSQSTEEFQAACMTLGGDLASRGYRILIGSLNPTTADYWVWQGAREVEKSAKIRLIATHLYVEEAEDFPADDYVVVDGTVSEARQELVRQAHGFIVISGASGTAEIYELAVEREVPRLAVSAFGGAAASFAKSDPYFENVRQRMDRDEGAFQWDTVAPERWIEILEAQMFWGDLFDRHTLQTIVASETRASVYLHQGSPFEFPTDMLVIPTDLKGETEPGMRDAIRYRQFTPVGNSTTKEGDVRFVQQPRTEPPHVAYATVGDSLTFALNIDPEDAPLRILVAFANPSTLGKPGNSFLESDVPPENAFVQLRQDWLQKSVPENASQAITTKFGEKLNELFLPASRLTAP